MAVRPDEQLGILPLIVGAVTLAPQISKVVSESTALFAQHPKDATRLKANLAAFQTAATGDQTALHFLLIRSGTAGQDTFPVTNYNDTATPIGGWADAAPRADALDKYNKVRALLGGQPMPNTPALAGAGSVTPLLIGAAIVGFLVLRKR
jgi:hypothetical protein